MISNLYCHYICILKNSDQEWNQNPGSVKKKPFDLQTDLLDVTGGWDGVGWDGIAAVSAWDRIVLVSLIPHGQFAPGREAVMAEKSEPQHNSGLLDTEQ